MIIRNIQKKKDMKQLINISGMTCMACQSKVEKALYEMNGITEVHIELEDGSGWIKGDSIPTETELNSALLSAGNYHLSFDGATKQINNESSTQTGSYKPLIIVVCFILGVSLTIEIGSGMFLLETWMANFMAGFFISFSFFKMLDIEGFANSYRTYDIVARNIPFYAKLYPFIELGLGLSYILFADNPLTHLIAAIIMFVSLIGVVQAVSSKKKIQCACLGTVFNLPMSSVTIIEDAIMLGMAVVMYIL